MRCIPNLKRLTNKDSIFWFDLCGWRLTDDQALKMVYIRQKSRADANHESTPRIKHEIDTHKLPTPSRTVFTQEQNELFVQQVFQESQGLEGEVLYYHILGLNEYATENNLKSLS